MKKTARIFFAAVLAVLPFAPPAAAHHCTLCKAAEEGNIPELRRLLDKGADLEASHWGQGALYKAVVNYKYDTALFLLDKGANPNKRQKGTNNPTPFSLSANTHAGNTKAINVFKKMLAKGGKVNDKHAEPILMRPAARGNHEIVKLLLKAGAEIDGRVIEVVEDEVRGRYPDDAKRMRRALQKSKTGGEFLKYYISNNDVDGLKEALKNINPNYAYRGENGKTALMHAAHKKNEKLLEALLEKNPDVDAQDKQGKTALMYAAERGRIKTSRMLLERDANTEINDKRGKTVWDIVRNKYVLRAIFRQVMLAKHSIDVGEEEEEE